MTVLAGGGRHRVAAIVPVIDEAVAIGELTSGLLAAGACCVYVVDGGSHDGTPDVAGAAGAIVVTEDRRGYGRACLTGAAAAAVDHPIIAFLDGDGSCDAEDLPVLLAALDDADLVLGARAPGRTDRGALPWHARLGNMLVAALLRRRTGGRVHDLPPFKVIRRAALTALDLDDAGFGWTVQLVARALRTPGLRVVEVPARFRVRRGGRSKVSGSPRASFAAGRRMITCALTETRRRPLIALMAKAPRVGHAKTRLAADIGQEAALELWTACLADLGPAIRAAARGVADTIAIVPAQADAEPVAALLGPGWSTVIQRRPGLGGAIADGFVEAQVSGRTARSRSVATTRRCRWGCSWTRSMRSAGMPRCSGRASTAAITSSACGSDRGSGTGCERGGAPPASSLRRYSRLRALATRPRWLPRPARWPKRAFRRACWSPGRTSTGQRTSGTSREPLPLPARARPARAPGWPRMPRWCRARWRLRSRPDLRRRASRKPSSWADPPDPRASARLAASLEVRARARRCRLRSKGEGLILEDRTSLIRLAIVGLAIGILVPTTLALMSGAPLLVSRAPLATPSDAGSAATDASSSPLAHSTTPATAKPTPTPSPRPTKDTTRPTIVSRSPGPNAAGVSGGTTIRIRFSEPVKGVSGSSIQLVNTSGGWTVRSSVSYNASTRTATLNPALNMYPSTTYRVSILTGITDRAGNRLASTTWTFTVAPG